MTQYNSHILGWKLGVIKQFAEVWYFRTTSNIVDTGNKPILDIGTKMVVPVQTRIAYCVYNFILNITC